MKVQADPHASSCPSLVTRQGETVAALSKMMVAYGLASVTGTLVLVDRTDAYTFNVAYTKLAIEVPKDIEIMQERAARWIADGLNLFGVHRIVLDLTTAELDAVRRSWTQDVPRITPKLPPACDPTNTLVLIDEP